MRKWQKFRFRMKRKFCCYLLYYNFQWWKTWLLTTDDVQTFVNATFCTVSKPFSSQRSNEIIRRGEIYNFIPTCTFGSHFDNDNDNYPNFWCGALFVRELCGEIFRMNRIMMVGMEWGKAFEMRNFHSEHSSCKNMCREGEDSGKSRHWGIWCEGEILNIACVIVSNSSYTLETRIRKDKE